MEQDISYQEFINLVGRATSEVDPGSEMIVLEIEDALKSIELLSTTAIAILGGDVFSENPSGKLMHAFQIWGIEFHFLDWYCNNMENESEGEYANRTYEVAVNGIRVAKDFATKLKQICYIGLVVK